MDTISEALAVNVESRCQCGFSKLNILEAKFRCFTEDGTHVTYRAEIIGTGEASPYDIAENIQDWIQGAVIIFDYVEIGVDSSCQVILMSLLDPDCNTQTETPPSATLLGGVIGAVTVVVAVSITVFVLVCCWMKRSGRLRERCIWYT